MHRSVLRSLAVVVAALVVLSACGGGSDDEAATPTTEQATSTTKTSVAADEAADDDPTSDDSPQADPADVDAAIENCLGGDLLACLFLGTLRAQVPPQIEPDDDQRNATDDQIRTECFDFEILSACYEAGVRQLGQDGDDVPPDDIGETLTGGCAGGDSEACLELGQRKFPPPPSFAGSFQDEPDVTVRFECFEVGVQEACYEAGLRNIDADTVIGE